MKESRGVNLNRQYKSDKVTEIIPNCPTCGSTGQVTIIADYGNVMLECDCCSNAWMSSTKDCPVCHEPNNYVVPGICEKCYTTIQKLKKGVS